MNENEFRDFLFGEYRESLFNLIKVELSHPPRDRSTTLQISELVKSKTTQHLNARIRRLSELIVDGKEVKLFREEDATTRVDLIGHLEDDGDLVIIELKKSNQTERQAFNELLSYANHFCTLFPFLTESSFMSILIAPMEGRGVRDAFAQELVVNGKNIVAFKPDIVGNVMSLTPHYPSDLYYRWIENHLLSDEGFTVITASFPLIEGWIDAGDSDAKEPPQYSKDAFHIITRTLAQKAERLHLSGFVYARQRWREIGQVFPHPNTIVLCLFNPFSPIQADVHEGEVYGRAPESRIDNLQKLIDQFQDSEEWLYGLYSSFQGQGIRIIQETFDELFGEYSHGGPRLEIELPNWKGFKESPIESAFCHNVAINTFGLIQVIVDEYFRQCHEVGWDELFYADDLPKYPYQNRDNLRAVWEIINGISQADEE